MLIRGTHWKQGIREILAERQRKAISRKDLKPSAVLIPIYENEDECHIVLTKRSQDVEYHKGQVSFPGGAYDDVDRDLKTTALREAFEEVGIRPGDVEILGKLDDQATATSYFAITPFVGAMPYPYNFKVNRWEVDALIEAPVSALLDPANFSPRNVEYEGKMHCVASYFCGEHHVTGITAIILQQLLDLVFI